MKNPKKASLSFLFLVAGCIIFLSTACSPKKDPPKKFQVVGYLYNKKVNLHKLPYQYLTVINYSFAVPAPDSSGNIMPLRYPNRLKNLTKTAHAHGVKVFISIGGGNLGDGPGNDTRFEVLANGAKHEQILLNRP